MKPAEVIALLAQNGIEAVIIGGVAMRLHRSPRVTQDLDVSVPSMHVDPVMRLMYQHGFVVVTAVTETGAEVAATIDGARQWVESAHPGSITFVARPSTDLGLGPQEVPHEALDVESQVDVLYDLAVPFGRLLHDSHTVTVAGVTIRYAAAHHLVQLKEARSDRSAADESDLAYLRALLAEGEPE